MKHLKSPVILSTAYLPNIQYISKLLIHNETLIDIHETYLKQSFRNRCQIYGANGKQDLSIPVIKPNGNRTITKDILIEYKTNWMQVHWRAIISAYNKSPFFEFFEHELAPLFFKKEKFLIDFNDKALNLIFELLGYTVSYKYSNEYQRQTENIFDYRNSIHPKKRLQKEDRHFNALNYYQVFDQKHEFIENLSFIDLMFNEGPQAIDICLKSAPI